MTLIITMMTSNFTEVTFTRMTLSFTRMALNSSRSYLLFNNDLNARMTLMLDDLDFG